MKIAIGFLIAYAMLLTYQLMTVASEFKATQSRLERTELSLSLHKSALDECQREPKPLEVGP